MHYVSVPQSGFFSLEVSGVLRVHEHVHMGPDLPLIIDNSSANSGKGMVELFDHSLDIVRRVELHLSGAAGEILELGRQAHPNQSTINSRRIIYGKRWLRSLLSSRVPKRQFRICP
jgi:hypothetical protein